jgi:hypothetical protein
MSDFNPSPTPFQSRVKLIVDCETHMVDATLYHQLVGSLIYLTHSMLDISFFLNMVSRFMQNPHESHWKKDKIILSYLQGTLNYGVFYSHKASISFIGYTNYDLTGDVIGKCSNTRCVFQLG